jgi:hypothetical protein
MMFVFLLLCLLVAIVPSWGFIWYLIRANMELVKTIGNMSTVRFSLPPSFLPLPKDDVSLDEKGETTPVDKVKTTGQYL